MKANSTILVCVLLIMLSVSSVSGQYFYNGGRQVPLEIDSTKMLLRFDPAVLSGDHDNLLSSLSRYSGVIESDDVTDGFIVCSLTTGANYGDYLDSVESIDEIYSTEPYYLNGRGEPYVVCRRFCVAFDESVAKSVIDSINAANRVVVHHELENMPNVYVLLNTDSSGLGILDLANLYYEMDETRYSHPEFAVWLNKDAYPYHIYDEYASYQWQLQKVIGTFNVASVWDFGRLKYARPVAVAVIDDGIEVHEDLPPERILPGYDYADDDDDPSPVNARGHGLACAGIIAASHFSSIDPYPNPGVFSMAPKSKIMPVKVYHDDGTSNYVFPSAVADAISYAWKHGAEIISMSSSYPFSCSTYSELEVPNQFEEVEEAVDGAFYHGRGWLGTPIIFSAGNLGVSQYGVNFPGCLPSAFSVGAIDANDRRWYYSGRGHDLNLVAPSGNSNFLGDVWSIDRMGSYGFNPNVITGCPPESNDENYFCRFGGTSAAAPVVSGTAALILAYDQTLTSAEVYEILEGSAETQLDWGTITPPDTAYGYGRVDAFRAILSLARGDINSDGSINNADITALIDYIYMGGAGGFPDVRLGNCNCSGDGKINLSDLTTLIDYVYVNHTPLPLPCFNYLYPNQ